MAKDLSISYLLDFYGQMLTDKQREVTEFYYNDDLSLAEIADHCHITRQGVRDSIKRAEAQLREYEEKLGLARRFVEIQAGLDEITRWIFPSTTTNSSVLPRWRSVQPGSVSWLLSSTIKPSSVRPA